MELYIGMFLILSGMGSFLSMRKHVLSMLLSIEFMMIGVFYIFCLSMMNFLGEIYFFILFLSFVACEGSLGLSIIILLTRSKGNDYIFNLNLLKC
uniref:NADH-ubiquinone oxidoreductase chain 4L n=1 Tax=Brachycybe lecontii TaxID=1176341 RepID=S4SZX7_BRALC|nr:NADH dehydrogenase subunit 4L [Brachycybe lecontii]AFR77047.1 NADH dehydrogenase subunit 4L [Brachycybe lecontii]